MRRSKTICTIVFVIINILVFIWLSFFGMTENSEFMLKHGAMYVPVMLENHEYYRVITSLFMHFGFDHLLNNMIMLYLLGSRLEEEIGGIKYTAVYLVSGFFGNVLSAVIEIKTDSFAVSAGASGAIFGIIGSLLYIALRNKGRIGNLSSRGILFMVACSLYFGFTSSGIDNFAHIGGLLSGFLMTALVYRKKEQIILH